MSVLLLLSLYVITVIQLTSSQSTNDVIQQENDVTSSCERTEQVLAVLSQLQKRADDGNMERQVLTALSQLRKDVASLQKDVTELKTVIGPKNATGMLMTITTAAKWYLTKSISSVYAIVCTRFHCC